MLRLYSLQLQVLAGEDDLEVEGDMEEGTAVGNLEVEAEGDLEEEAMGGLEVEVVGDLEEVVEGDT